MVLGLAHAGLEAFRVERNGGRRAVARGLRRLRLTGQRREQRETGGERGREERASREHHEAGPFELATPRSIRSAPSRCCQCNRPSTSMPSSGAGEVGQGDHAQPLGANAALQREVGADDAAGDPAAGGARAHRLLAGKAQAIGERGRDRDAGRAGVDEEIDALAVQRSRPVIVAVAAAPDLDDAAGGREGRLLRLVLAPLVGDEDDGTEDQPDRRELERSRQVVAHRQAFARRAARSVAAAPPRLIRAPPSGRWRRRSTCPPHPSSRSGSCRRSA